MARQGTRISEELGQIVRAVLGDMSVERAARNIDYALSGNAINRLQSGKVGLESTVRAFATGFAERICGVYGGEVREQFGRCDAETAADWLCGKAGFERWAKVPAGSVAETARPAYDTSPLDPAAQQYIDAAIEATVRRLIPNPSGAEILVKRLIEIQAEFPGVFPWVPLTPAQKLELTPEAAEELAADLRQQVAEAARSPTRE